MEDSEVILENAIELLIDPITLELMVEPVIASDNHSYDKTSLEKWFFVCRSQGRELTSPMTNQTLKSPYIYPNVALRVVLLQTIERLERIAEKGLLSERLQMALTCYHKRRRDETERDLSIDSFYDDLQRQEAVRSSVVMAQNMLERSRQLDEEAQQLRRRKREEVLASRRADPVANYQQWWRFFF